MEHKASRNTAVGDSCKVYIHVICLSLTIIIDNSTSHSFLHFDEPVEMEAIRRIVKKVVKIAWLVHSIVCSCKLYFTKHPKQQNQPENLTLLDFQSTLYKGKL